MKLCKNCKHAIEGGGSGYLFFSYTIPWRCGHTTLREPVHGNPYMDCAKAREDAQPCGPSGRMWEEGEPTVPMWLMNWRASEERRQKAEEARNDRGPTLYVESGEPEKKARREVPAGVYGVLWAILWACVAVYVSVALVGRPWGWPAAAGVALLSLVVTLWITRDPR